MVTATAHRCRQAPRNQRRLGGPGGHRPGALASGRSPSAERGRSKDHDDAHRGGAAYHLEVKRLTHVGRLHQPAKLDGVAQRGAVDSDDHVAGGKPRRLGRRTGDHLGHHHPGPWGEPVGVLQRRVSTGRRSTTRAKYDSLLRLHVGPALGPVELSKLAPSVVRNWYHALAESKPTAADDAYRFLRAVANTGVTDRVIGRNPCQVRGAGQVRSMERPSASVAEVTAAVEAVPERYRLAVLLPAWCQLRRGEVVGLQRRDVDLVHGTLRVERALVQPNGTEPVLGPPKTAAGTRTLNVPANVIPALQDHLERFVAPGPTAWLFEGENHSPVSPRTMSQSGPSEKGP